MAAEQGSHSGLYLCEVLHCLGTNLSKPKSIIHTFKIGQVDNDEIRKIKKKALSLSRAECATV